jgi:hypothetical protein
VAESIEMAESGADTGSVAGESDGETASVFSVDDILSTESSGDGDSVDGDSVGS